MQDSLPLCKRRAKSVIVTPPNMRLNPGATVIPRVCTWQGDSSDSNNALFFDHVFHGTQRHVQSEMRARKEAVFAFVKRHTLDTIVSSRCGNPIGIISSGGLYNKPPAAVVPTNRLANLGIWW